MDFRPFHSLVIPAMKRPSFYIKTHYHEKVISTIPSFLFVVFGY